MPMDDLSLLDILFASDPSTLDDLGVRYSASDTLYDSEYIRAGASHGFCIVS